MIERRIGFYEPTVFPVNIGNNFPNQIRASKTGHFFPKVPAGRLELPAHHNRN